MMNLLTRCTNDAEDGTGEVIEAEAKQLVMPAEAQLVHALQSVTRAIQSMKDEQQQVAAALTDLANSQKTAEPEAKVEPEDKGATIIEMNCLIRRIFNVDTVNQTFAVSMTVVMLWDMPENEEPPQPWEDDGDWVPRWRPVYRVRRVIEEVSKTERFYSVKKNGRRMVKAEMEHLVVLFEELELRSFPVDCQDLLISIESQQTTEQVQWRADQSHDGPAVKLSDSRFALSDFSLVMVKDTLPGYTWHFGKEVYPQDDKECCKLRVIVKVQRKYQYYMINVILMILAIVSLSLCSWFNHPADVANRQAVDFSLILTAVAFKLVLSSMLPTVSYMTLLDYYVLGGFAFLIMVTVCHSVMPFAAGVKFSDNSVLTLPPNSYAGEEDLVYVDNWTLWIAGIIWCSFNLVYAMVFEFTRKYCYGQFVHESIKQQREWDKDNYLSSGLAKLEGVTGKRK